MIFGGRNDAGELGVLGWVTASRLAVGKRQQAARSPRGGIAGVAFAWDRALRGSRWQSTLLVAACFKVEPKRCHATAVHGLGLGRGWF